MVNSLYYSDITMSKWRKPRMVYRVVVECKDENEDEGLTMTFDVLKEDMNSDTINDLFAFLDWIYGSWEVIEEREIEIFSWKEMRNDGRWHMFYREYGTGEDLHV